MGELAADVSCKLCYERFTTKHPYRVPRKLTCLHYFCTECLQKLHHLQGVSIECPSCLAITSIPPKGVDYLPTHYQALSITEGSKTYDKCSHCVKTTYPPKKASLHCVDCNSTYCGSCSDTVHLQVGNQDHVVRLANSYGDTRLSRESSARSSRDASARSSKRSGCESGRSSVSPSPICVTHEEYLTLYCEHKQVRMCAKCKLTPQHSGHDCNMMEKREEEERALLQDLRDELEQKMEAYSKARKQVQIITENLNSNFKITNDNIHRYFNEMRNAVDESEKNVMTEVQKIFDRKSASLKEQFSSMIDALNTARRVSEEADNVVDMEYYQMLVEKKKIELRLITSLQDLGKLEPCENAQLFVQFPHHEHILSSIRTSPYIVRAPPPPHNFQCTLLKNKVVLKWDYHPQDLKYTYQPTMYAVYASIGAKDSLVMLEKVKSKELTIGVDDPKLLGKHLVQFKASAINVVGEGKSCNPVCIRLVATRYLED